MTTYRDVTVERLPIDAEIRDLAARFSDAVNRGDIYAFGALFVDDGGWEIGELFPRRAADRRNVVAMLRSPSAPWDFFFQMTHSGVIDVNPGRQTATARWQVQEIARSRTVRSPTTTSRSITTGSREQMMGHGVLPNAATTTSGSAALTSGAARSLTRMPRHDGPETLRRASATAAAATAEAEKVRGRNPDESRADQVTGGFT